MSKDVRYTSKGRPSKERKEAVDYWVNRLKKQGVYKDAERVFIFDGGSKASVMLNVKPPPIASKARNPTKPS